MCLVVGEPLVGMECPLIGDLVEGLLGEVVPGFMYGLHMLVLIHLM